MAGIAATDGFVVVADRDLLDSQDIFRCLDAQTGQQLWTVQYFARGQLDFGNAPRATPQIDGERVFLYGAFGKLHCVRLADGEVLWKKDLLAEFGNREDAVPWGTTSSPLLVDDKLIVNPGGAESSLVALRPDTGEVIWKTPGDKPAFGSLIVATLEGRRQIVGYDKRALCGWDVNTGKQLWRLVPPRVDFNVSTPIVVGEQLLVSTENNGTRLYRFDSAGAIVPQPIAHNDDLAPDTHTPVALADRVFGVWQDLYCLDCVNNLKTLWKGEDSAFDGYASIIGSGNKILVISKHGELLLVDAIAEKYRLISRLQVFTDDPGVYSHPAIVGKQLYLRGSDQIVCLDLEPDNN